MTRFSNDDMMEVAGSWSDVSDEEVERFLKKLREAWRGVWKK